MPDNELILTDGSLLFDTIKQVTESAHFFNDS